MNEDAIVCFHSLNQHIRKISFPKGKEIQPLFYVDKGDTIKMLSVHAKSCRGAMTKFIIQNRIDQPSDIFNFELNGFRYAPNYGDELHPHFIKK